MEKMLVSLTDLGPPGLMMERDTKAGKTHR